jgi:hypothetical protein
VPPPPVQNRTHWGSITPPPLVVRCPQTGKKGLPPLHSGCPHLRRFAFPGFKKSLPPGPRRFTGGKPYFVLRGVFPKRPGATCGAGEEHQEKYGLHGLALVKRLSVRGTQKRDEKCFTGRASDFFPCRFFLLRFWAFLDKGNSKTRLKKITKSRVYKKSPGQTNWLVFLLFFCRPLLG